MNQPVTNNAPLSGIRVLDLSTVVAGPFGSEILGYLGADVIRIDPPSAKGLPVGDGPEGAPVTDAEGFTWALQRNKRAIVLDLKAPEGKAAFLELVRRSDVVFENFRPGVMDRLGLGAEALAAANPGIVYCAISGFGADGPWAKVAAYDAIVQALGGSMSITGTGEPGDIPCRLGVPIGDIGGSLYAVIGVIASLLERARTGRGKALDISLLDVQLAMNTYRVPQTFGSGIDFGVPSPRRGGAGATPYGPFRCADGAWLVIGVASNFWPAFCRVLGREPWIEDPRFATLAQRQANQPELERLVEERLAQESAGHWQDLLTAASVPAARVNQIHEAFEHPQARARQALVEFRQAGGRVVRAAAHPVRWIGEAPFAQRAPVAIGTDTEAVLAALHDSGEGANRHPREGANRHPREGANRHPREGGDPGLPETARAARSSNALDSRLRGNDGVGLRGNDGVGLRGNDGVGGMRGNDSVEAAIAALACQSGPLAGTLVLEFCGDEPSGTLGTQILADLGATVLKIERPPATDPTPVAATEPGKVPRAVTYAFGLNRNKRSITLDLKSEAGRELALRLARLADVVYENHKPGVMAKLGLGGDALRAVNPSLVVCSVSGYGQAGPWSAQPAYDATIQAVSGVMSITGNGRDESAPVRWGNPIGGIAGALYAVIGILAALMRRGQGGHGIHASEASEASQGGHGSQASGASQGGGSHGGQGAWLDVALFDAQLALHAYRVPTAMSGRRYAPEAHRGGSGALPYGPFLARDGQWFVLAITSQFWAKACDALGHPEWTDDPRFATEALRQANEDALNALVGAAMATQDAQFWQDRFVERGIPGATVLSIRDAFAHPQAQARRMLAAFDVQHPVPRHVQVAGDPIRFIGEPRQVFRPVPGLGADGQQVLATLLQVPSAEQAALRAQRVTWWPEAGLVYERPSVV